MPTMNYTEEFLAIMVLTGAVYVWVGGSIQLGASVKWRWVLGRKSLLKAIVPTMPVVGSMTAIVAALAMGWSWDYRYTLSVTAALTIILVAVASWFSDGRAKTAEPEQD